MCKRLYSSFDQNCDSSERFRFDIESVRYQSFIIEEHLCYGTPHMLSAGQMKNRWETLI